MKRKALPVAGTPGREKKIKMNTPKIYNRHIREVTLQTPLGPQKCNALFDTGANIIVLDNQWAAQFSLSYLERDEPLQVFGFSGQQDHTAGKSGGKPDALSRRPEYAEGGGEENSKPLLSPEIFVSAINTLHPLLVKILQPGAKLPIRGSDLAAGIDVMANELATIPPNERMAISTSITIATLPGT